MGEKPSPSGEDFSRLGVWSNTVDQATPYTILNTQLSGFDRSQKKSKKSAEIT
jgi:hypothetical protein